MEPEARSGTAAPEGLLVSIVVPVHNGGTALAGAIESAMDQTLPADRYEAIFVDDGSTDGSGEQLDEAAARHPNLVVIHTPASGSPGPPRNLGIERARGAYLQFLDADDRLGRRALERQLEIAREHDSDIVIGKLASNFRGVHWALYRKTVGAGTLTSIPVMGSLTPHKMFRTAMIREHGIRFPEGWRLIEDQDFVVRSYIAARTISVVADEACYLYAGRDDGQNLTLQPFDPDVYYGHLRQILDGVAGLLEPGPAREEVERRFYHVEMLGKLEGDAFLGMDPAERRRLVDAVRRLALDRIGDNVHASLPAVTRTRSTLLRDGRLDDLVAFAEREAQLRLEAVATGVAAATEGLKVRYRLRARWSDGTPLVLVPDGEHWRLDPRLVPDGLVPAADTRVDAASLQVQAALHEDGGFLEWMVRTSGTVTPAHGLQHGERRERRPRPLEATGTLTADPGAPGPSRHSLGSGEWTAVMRLRGLGVDLRAPLTAATGLRLPEVPWLLAEPPGAARMATGPDGTVRLAVTSGEAAARALLAERPGMRLQHGRILRLRWPVATGPATREAVDLAVAPPTGDEAIVLPVAVNVPAHDPGTVHIRARVKGTPQEGSLVLRAGGVALADAGTATADGSGGLRLTGIDVRSLPARGADGLAALQFRARSLAGRVRRRLARVIAGR